MSSLEQQSAARQLWQFNICRAGTVANLPADIHKRTRGVTRREGFATLNHSRPTNKILSILLSCRNIPIESAKLLGATLSGGAALAIPTAPSVNHHYYSAQVKRLLGGAKKMLLLSGIAALAHGAIPNVYGSMITPSFAQDDDGSTTASSVQFDLLNNDTSVTYDNGEMKYNDLLIGVAQAVQANNSDYTTNTIEEIMGDWTYQISPDSEVKSGWTASLNNGQTVN